MTQTRKGKLKMKGKSQYKVGEVVINFQRDAHYLVVSQLGGGGVHEMILLLI